MGMDYMYPAFEVLRNPTRCVNCGICVKECANGVHFYQKDGKLLSVREELCVNCGRCAAFCPTHALKILKSPPFFRENENWSCGTIQEIYRQAKTGGVLLSSMGNPNPLPVYWDRILINASQVTNPPIDAIRVMEPNPDRIFYPTGGEPVIVQVKGGAF